MITTEELASIRAAAIGDMLGDPGALDEMGSAATVFRLCRELELARKHSVTMSEVAKAAWGGEIPSPLPGHTHMTEEEFTERYNCPWCEGCNLRGLHSCQNLVSRQLYWIQKADELIKRREAVEEGEESCPKN